MLESLCNKVADLQTCNVIKKRLQHRCFPVNILNPLRTPILKIMWKRLLPPLEVFCFRTSLILAMRMLHLAYYKTIWLQLIYFFTTIAFGLFGHLGFFGSMRTTSECLKFIILCENKLYQSI